jgi:hypothetical protein
MRQTGSKPRYVLKGDFQMVKYCAQCKRGEKKTDADFKVKGRIWGINSNKMTPYQAAICEDHLMILMDDGAELKITERLSKRVQDEYALLLILEHTAWGSLTHFLMSTPTLRKFEGAEWLQSYWNKNHH